MINDYISISEFAKLAKKKPQTIYKQLNNRLNSYVKLVDSQKMLNSKALYDIYNITVEQPIQPEFSNSFNSLEHTLTTTIELLQQQLIIKDNQIEHLSKQIDALNARLAEAHQMADKAQQLHSADKILQIESKSSFWNKFKKTK